MTKYIDILIQNKDKMKEWLADILGMHLSKEWDKRCLFPCLHGDNVPSNFSCV